MALWRAQVFFADLDAVGWSETYWNQAAVSSDDLGAKLNNLLQKRVALLGYSAVVSNIVYPTVKYIRLEDASVKQITFLKTLPGFINDVKQRQVTAAEVAWSTVFYRIANNVPATAVRSIRELSGVPDVEIVDPDNTPNNQDWAKAFQAWKIYLQNTNNGWAIPRASYTPYPGMPIALAVRNADGSILLSFSGDPIPGQNSLNGYMRGWTPRQWNGRVVLNRVLPPAGLVFQSVGKIFKPISTSLTLGTVNTKGITLVPITDVDLRGQTAKKRGRPFGLHRGRRPTARVFP